jgi:RNA polymerase sigma factor (sigma-70 family)
MRPPRPPIDELVRVEENDSDHDRECDDRHGAKVHGNVEGSLVSGKLLSHKVDAAVNPAGDPGNEAEVSAAADVLPFLPPRVRDCGPVSQDRPTRAHMTDDAGHDGLVTRAAAGDPAAFRALFTRHKSDVARLVYRMLNAPADLDDVIQEVFVQVFRSLKDFRGQAKFSTWLHRVTVNVVLMHRRSARSRPVLTEEMPGELVADDSQTLPDDDVERRERMRAFQRLLARLADKKRIVFVLHELEGMTPSEIAEVVGAPVLTVRTRLFYARRELEAMLSEEPTLANLVGLASPSADAAAGDAATPARARAAKGGAT